jgi:hypothetical protein
MQRSAETRGGSRWCTSRSAHDAGGQVGLGWVDPAAEGRRKGYATQRVSSSPARRRGRVIGLEIRTPSRFSRGCGPDE